MVCRARQRSAEQPPEAWLQRAYTGSQGVPALLAGHAVFRAYGTFGPWSAEPNTCHISRSHEDTSERRPIEASGHGRGTHAESATTCARAPAPVASDPGDCACGRVREHLQVLP